MTSTNFAGQGKPEWGAKCPKGHEATWRQGETDHDPVIDCPKCGKPRLPSRTNK
jgi:hypothetical protein